MADFWRSSGYNLLERGADGRLIVTDDYLRAYFTRPELAPVEESCGDECALHAALLQNPRLNVEERQIEAIRDRDARENYRVMLRFRAQLLATPSLEAFYSGLFRHEVAVRWTLDLVGSRLPCSALLDRARTHQRIRGTPLSSVAAG